jgi:hypothetical protein
MKTNNVTSVFRLPSKMHSRCFGIMAGHGNFAFKLAVKLSVKLGYVMNSVNA